MKNIFGWISCFSLLLFAVPQIAESKDIDSSALDILGFHVGGFQTLKDVASRLGETSYWKTGDAGDAASKICYRIPGEIGDTILVFGSDTEMASQNGQINFIQIIGPGGSFTEQQNCSPLHSSVAQPLVASNGLRLGMSLAEVTSIYGKATSFKGGLAQFSSCHKRYLLESDPYFKRWVGKAGCFEDPSRPYFDECSLVKVYFKRGRAISITVSMNQSVC